MHRNFTSCMFFAWSGYLGNNATCCRKIYILCFAVIHNRKKTIEKKYRICIYVLGIFGWGLHFFGTLYMSAGTSEINSIFKGYQNIPAIMHSISIFVFLKNINYRKIFRKQYELFEKIVNKIDSLTFGVYLIHNFFIIYLITKFQININTLSWRLGGGMIIVAALMSCH